MSNLSIDQDELNHLLASPDSDLELFKLYRKRILTQWDSRGRFGPHSCNLDKGVKGSRSYFGYATQDQIITRQPELHESVAFSRVQIEAISNLYLSSVVDLARFKEAVFRHGIAWWTEIWPEVVSSKYERTSYTQFEVVLRGLSSELFIAGIELANTEHFLDSNIDSKLPLTQRQIEQLITERLFSKFFWDHYQCDHANDSRTCILCGKKFSIAHSMPLFVGQPALICYGCCDTSPPSEVNTNNPEDYQSIVRARFVFAAKRFVEHYNLVPPANFDCSSAAISSANETLTNEEAIRNWVIAANMPDVPSAIELFGSWAKFLDEAGVLTQSRSGQSGYRSFASDGHLCLSIGERQICEFLFLSGVEHERETPYPRDDEFNKNGLKRSDFLIGDTFVELAGRMSDDKYAEGMKDKIALARRLGFSLIVITPKELPNLGKTFQNWLI